MVVVEVEDMVVEVIDILISRSSAKNVTRNATKL